MTSIGAIPEDCRSLCLEPTLNWKLQPSAGGLAGMAGAGTSGTPAVTGKRSVASRRAVGPQ